MTDHVYWKGLKLVLRAVQRYITKWQIQLQNNVDGPTYDCIVATLEAVITCLSALPTDTPVE